MTEHSPYAVEFSDRAKKALKRFDKAIAARILERLDGLAQGAEEARHYA